jgi:hypothetical protein
METSDLSALAGNTLVAAARTEAWDAARQGFASLFGGDQPDAATENRLDTTRRDLLAAAPVDQQRVQAALAGRWATRIADLLDELPDTRRPQAEADLRTLVGHIRAQLPVGPAPAPPTRNSRFSFLRHVSPVLSLASGILFLAGFVFIGFYVASNQGPHLRYLGVGWLAACAAFVTGSMAGLVVGIPRFVSSGALRHDIEAGRPPARPAGTVGSAQVTAPDQAGPDQVSSFTPSSNLAEISDWLTKLLLGAGLVELTRLAGPLRALVDVVARGLGSVPPSSPATVVAAAILVTYVILGFLDGYVVTTLWYGKHLQQLGYQ